MFPALQHKTWAVIKCLVKISEHSSKFFLEYKSLGSPDSNTRYFIQLCLLQYQVLSQPQVCVSYLLICCLLCTPPSQRSDVLSQPYFPYSLLHPEHEPEPLTRLEQAGQLWAGHHTLFYSELVVLDFSGPAGQEEENLESEEVWNNAGWWKLKILSDHTIDCDWD